MPKKRINTQEFVDDVRSGLTDKQLMRKFRLTQKQLSIVYEMLLDDGRLDPSDLEDDQTPVFEATVELAGSCPFCGALRQPDSDRCPECGFVY